MHPATAGTPPEVPLREVGLNLIHLDKQGTTRACPIGLTIDSVGVTLVAVSRTANAVPLREVATEIVAVALFGRAHEAGVAITRRWVDGELDRLRSHPNGCHCSEPCQLVARTTANKVHWVASGWQRQYGGARVLARR
jgi:hypothetical protein